MKGFPEMRSKAAAIVALIALATALAGCGSSPNSPKRAVDARTEVVHFFATDAPVVAILQTEPVSDVVALSRAASSVPVWHSLLATVVRPLFSAGLTQDEVVHLVTPHEEIEGIPSSALGLGFATPADLKDRQPLLVLATDQSDFLSHLFREALGREDVVPAGRLHDAILYKNRAGAYAVRDGVLICARNVADVRSAILRRDGNSDNQLDEDVVESLFNDLTQHGPLQIYADLDDLRQADPGLAALGEQKHWTASLQPTTTGLGLHVEAFAKSTGPDLTTSGIPVGTEPRAFAVSAATASTLLGAGPTQSMLDLLVPFAGQATVSSDEVRVNLRLGG